MISRNTLVNPYSNIDTNPKRKTNNNSNLSDNCPNCGNTRPIFQHFQNGLLVCFICRKASFNDYKINISAF